MVDTFDITPSGDGGNPRTMSSREIAALTGKEHKNVVRDIRAMLDGLKIEPVVFEATYADAKGEQRACFDLPQRECLILVSGYNVELRARIVDRWAELEAKERSGSAVTAEGLLANPRQLLAITQGYALQIEDMKRDMAIMSQDVAVVDRFGRADDWFGIRRSAKMLDMPERKFTDWLQRMGWAFRQNGTNVLLGYSDKQKKGYLKNAPHPYTRRDGSEGVRDQLVFSMAGLVRIAKMLNVTLRVEEEAA